MGIVFSHGIVCSLGTAVLARLQNLYIFLDFWLVSLFMNLRLQSFERHVSFEMVIIDSLRIFIDIFMASAPQ